GGRGCRCRRRRRRSRSRVRRSAGRPACRAPAQVRRPERRAQQRGGDHAVPQTAQERLRGVSLGPGRRSPLLAVVVLSACIGLLGGALAAWGIYARFGPVERVVTQPITVGGSGANAQSVGAVAQQTEVSVVEIGTRLVTTSSLLSGE